MIHQGIVVQTDDPINAGRLRARVPAVLGDALSDWARPCVAPGTLLPAGVPGVGKGVWITFVEGDPDAPVWLGTWQP